MGGRRSRWPKTLGEMEEYLFSNRVVTESGCWNWTRQKSTSGYGKIHWSRTGHFRVHRVAAMLWLGLKLKSKILVCHRCDNPACFNPEHLFLGTSSDNQKDSVSKGRHYEARKTHCHRGHPFTIKNTRICKSGARACRTCRCIDSLKSYYRNAGRVKK